MVTLDNKNTFLCQRGLAALAKERLPIATALRVRRLLRATEARLQDVEAVRQGLLRQHAALDEAGDPLADNGAVRFPSPQARAAFEADYDELLAQTWECPETLAPKDLGEISVTPETLYLLGDLLDD
jgi:hypothetical protein